jgi:hypothetical protein
VGTPGSPPHRRRPIAGDPGLSTPSTKTHRWGPRAPGPGWVDAYPSPPRVVLGKYPVFNGMATWIYRKHFVLRYLNSKYLKKRGLSGGCAMPEPTGISRLLWGRPLHGADARHLQCGRRSREARSGEPPEEHPEMIVRQMTIIIGKMVKVPLTMSEGPGPKGRPRLAFDFRGLRRPLLLPYHLRRGPLHGADARHLQCGRRSREARSGEPPEEHPEMIVRQRTIIIGKMVKVLLTMSEGPGPKGRFRIGCRFQEPEGPCSFRPV